MFFIIAFLCLIAVFIILIATRVHACFRLENKRLYFKVDWLLLRIRREYLISRDQDRTLALYRLTGDREKRVLALPEVFFTEKPNRDTSLIKLIRLALRSRQERRQSNPWFTILKKSRVDLRLCADLSTGDAFATAMVCGLLIAVGNALCAVISTKGKSFRVYVRPLFGSPSFSLRGDCIIDVTPANIILGYFIYKIKARGKKHASD